MSILIKGMDMPKDRPIVISIFPNGRVDTMEVKYFDSVLSAVEVPTPHGCFCEMYMSKEEQYESTHDDV